MKGTAASVLKDFYEKPKLDDAETEKMRVIKTAASLINDDIKTVVQDKDIYPTSLSMSTVEASAAFIPESLQLFLKTRFVGTSKELKVCSLGQAIMQATRSRILTAPLQLGLAVDMHSSFASRFLIDSLNALGFCSSYNEVLNYQQSASVSQGLDLSEFFPGQWMQYIADNVDHDIRTIDGRNTFHGMGIIAAVTPKTDVTSVVKRVSVSADDVASVGRITIKPFLPTGTELKKFKYECLHDFSPLREEDNKSLVDLLWKTSLCLRAPRPAWSGYMQLISDGDHPGKSSIMFLPMIDMNPSNMTCINSTLHFVSDHARRHDVVPVVTFDQPLW